MEKPWIIVLCHGTWGKYLIEDIKRMFGLKDNIFVYSLLSETSLESYRNEVEKTVSTSPKGSVIITDLYGGTTSNTAIYLGIKYERDAVSGLNVQLLLDIDAVRQEKTVGIVEQVLNNNETMYVDLIKKFKNMVKN